MMGSQRNLSLSFFAELKRRNVFKVGIAYATVAWLILQVADVALNNIAAPDWVFRSILLVLGIGLPLALIFAWAFEMTPEGIKHESEVDRSQSISSKTGRKLDFTIIGVLLVAVTYFIWESRFSEPVVEEVTSSEVSIAVLPFVNMSSDVEQEYFSDGISEEILNVLAHIPGMHVTSRSSSFQFKGENIDIPTVAARLGVEHVLEGSVRKDGDRVRITAQLIEAASDRHLWSETYDRDLTDIFAVQDEISLAIVAALKTTLGIKLAAPASAQRTVNSDAHNEYLRGVFQMEMRGKEPMEKAVEHFERAIAIDPDYVPALARLSMTLNLLPENASGLSEAEYLEKASPYTIRAFELDPDHWEANLAKGFDVWGRAIIEGTDLGQALPYLEKSLELNPSYGTSYAWLASVKRGLGDITGSLQILESAVAIAPLDRVLLNNLSSGYIRHGRFEEAQTIIDRLMTVSPFMAHSSSAHLASTQGRWADNAIALIQQLAVAPDSSNYRARRIVGDDLALASEAFSLGERDSYCDLYVLLGQNDEQTQCMERLLQTASGIGRTYFEGIIHSIRGNQQQAHALMEEAWEQFDHISNPIMPDSIHIAVRLAVGDREGAKELVEKTIEFVESNTEAGIVSSNLVQDKGMAYYLVGDKGKALPLLRKTVEGGLYISTHEWYKEEFRNDPEIQRLLARQDAKAEMERERFLTIMCGPANPVPEYWRPSEAACTAINVPGAN